jgi:hypothetical protein
LNYIDLNKRPSTQQTRNIRNSSNNALITPIRVSINESKSVAKSQLFPKIPLTEAKFDEVVRDLKKVIFERKLSYFEVFQNLDKNEDGFLTINEFAEGIDKYIRLSQTVKEGLFAYFDTLRIGMVDYPQFLAGLKKPPNSKKVRFIKP